MSVKLIPILLLLVTVVAVESMSCMGRPEVPEKECKSTCAFGNGVDRRKNPDKTIQTCAQCCMSLQKKYIRGSCSFGLSSSYRHCYCQKSTYNKVRKTVNGQRKKKEKGGSASGEGEGYPEE